MTPEEIVARLIYRDGLMLVIDKPPGLAVHKGPKGGESLEDYFDALRFGLPRPPALAHRLDRDTSGCLVLGRHRKALAALGRLFKSGQVGKTYWAVVAGGPPQDQGRIELPLGRKDATRGWWMKHDPSGRPAVTTWKVMGRTRFPSAGGDESGFLTWLALEPLTGRTHQLRVHCAPWDGRSSATASMEAPRGRTLPASICTHARSWCRSTRIARRSASPRRCRRTCSNCCARADGQGMRSRNDGDVAAAGSPPAQYSVAFKRSGAARSWASPPSLPSVNSARIVPLLGRLLRSTWRDGSHSFERTIAFAH